MDRFSKTTEIDTAEIAAAAMEDDTPKKSRISIIIALVSCILIAIIIWMTVMEADTNPFQREYDDVKIYASCTDVDPIDSTTITVKGLRKVIVDIKASDFKVVKVGENDYDVYLVGDMAGVYTIENESTGSSIIVSVLEK